MDEGVGLESPRSGEEGSGWRESESRPRERGRRPRPAWPKTGRRPQAAPSVGVPVRVMDTSSGVP